MITVPASSKPEVGSMRKVRNGRLALCIGALIATSCGYPRLSGLVDGGEASDGTTDTGSPPLRLELLAGDIGGPGNADGSGVTARFYSPQNVAVDSAGNVYVA